MWSMFSPITLWSRLTTDRSLGLVCACVCVYKCVWACVLMFCTCLCFQQVRFVEQQQLLRRDKRVIVHDKQLELPIQVHHDPSSFKRFFRGENGLVARDQIPGDVLNMNFVDPYFPDQWYYVSDIYDFSLSVWR